MKGVVAETAKKGSWIELFGNLAANGSRKQSIETSEKTFSCWGGGPERLQSPHGLRKYSKCDWKCPEHPALEDPAVNRGLAWMFSRASFQPQLLLSVIHSCWEQQIPLNLTIKIKKLLFISPGSLLWDLYSNLKVSLRLYLKATWISSGLW